MPRLPLLRVLEFWIFLYDVIGIVDDLELKKFPYNHILVLSKHKLIGATADMLRGPFWSFNRIFYSIISSISSKIVQKIFNIVNNGMFYSKYYQFQ
jgi:hypothetical protein